MRRVHFVDTSILCCLLQIPNYCQEDYAAVETEFKRIANDSEALLLPVACILEAGNHIAHISDGGVRRKIALEFADYLRDTADNQAPWSLCRTGLDSG